MAFDLPLLTDQGDVAIATKIPNALNALRDGSATSYGGVGNANTVTGTANAPIITTAAAQIPLASLINGHSVTMLPGLTNTAGATLKLDALVAKAILKVEAGAKVALVAGDIVANVEATLIFSVQSDGWILQGSYGPALLKSSNIFTQDQIIEKDIGELIVRTGVSAASARFSDQGVTDIGRAVMSSNATWTGAAWNRDDVAKPAWVLGMGGAAADSFGVSFAAAGANPIAFNTALTLDNTGDMSAGIVPLARMQRTEAFSKNAGIISGISAAATQVTGISLGTVNIGDRVFISGQAQLVKGATTGITSIQVIGVGPVFSFMDNFSFARTTASSHVSTETITISVFGILKVASSAALTVNLQASSEGSNSSIAVDQGQVHAIVLNNG